MLIARWATEALLKKLKFHRVVSVAGARQSGKTTLLLNAPIPNLTFRSLDESVLLQAAKSDPSLFVRRTEDTTLAIDEIQKAPDLIGEIKYHVDRHPEPGQYLISGSSDYRRLPQVNESLAGRVGFVRVRTLCEAELRGGKPGFLNALFEGRYPLSTPLSTSKREILECAIRGGYPGTLPFPDSEMRADWFSAYLDTQVLHDMREDWNTRKLQLVRTVLESAAVLSSRELNKKTLANQMDVAWATLDSYWSALEAMHLIDMVPGWAKKDYDRAGTGAKPLMTDSGLMAYLLKIFRPEDVLDNPELSQNEGEKLIETWVYNQLMPEVDLHPTWRAHHFRSRSHEVDLLIENERGMLLGIEVKAGESVGPDDFRHLFWLRDLLGEDRFRGVVLYSGKRVLSIGQGFFALPMSALWSDFSTWNKP